MPFLLWKNQYSVNIEQFDLQHKKLFTLINDLETAINNHNDDSGVNKTLDGLTAYTKEHFSSEEELMQQLHYPDFEEHREAHNTLLKEVVSWRTKAESGDIQPYDLLRFLMNWLVKHIMGMDKKYSAFFKSKSIR